MEGACFTLLDFEPSEVSFWRQGKLHKGNVPSISEMINYIVKARRWWSKITDSRLIEDAVEELELLFVYHTCQQEDVGIANKDVIRKIVKNFKDRKCSNHLENHESGAYQETVNLYEAYKMLLDLGNKETGTDPELKGLLEVDSYILATHKHLMRGLPMRTPGGLFSTEVRRTMAGGEVHQYPKFETHNEARDAVLRVVDRYNMLCFSIKNQEYQDEYLFLRNIFKCVVWLFYELLSLHPFGDGNGRLCRLMLNYAINVIMPFPVPLHDIFSSSRDAYLHSVITPRKSGGRPSELIRLLIESTYRCSKLYLKRLRFGTVALSKLNLFSLSDARNESMVTVMTFYSKAGNGCIPHKMSHVYFSVTDELMVAQVFVKARRRPIVTQVQLVRYVLQRCTESFLAVLILESCSYETFAAFFKCFPEKFHDVLLSAVRDRNKEFLKINLISVIEHSTKVISCVTRRLSIRSHANSVIKQLWSGIC